MRLVVVGGGITGLSTAYYAEKAAREAGLDLSVILIEAEPALGGKIRTETSQGFVIEGGPDSFITQKPWALQLCRELGLKEHLMETNDAQRHTYVLRKGKLRKMPDGLMLVVPTKLKPFLTSDILSLPGKMRMELDLFIRPRLDKADESLAHFIRRRLGNEALEVLAEPLMAGIHVADAEKLSLKATFPRFIDLEQIYGSLIKGMRTTRRAATSNNTALFMTLKGGLRELVGTLTAAIQGQILTGHRAVELRSEAEGTAYTVVLDDGRRLQADAVVLATPAFVSADLLQRTNGPLAEMLKAIRYVSTATLSLGYDARSIEHPLNGFGFVVARSERTNILACTWTSTKFNYRASTGTVLLRAFVGGPGREELVQMDDESLVTLVGKDLNLIMGISAKPQIARVFRWMRANPQYDVGHLERVDQMEALLSPGVYLTGSAYRGVGIPDCVRQAQITGEQAVQHLLKHPQPKGTFQHG